MPGPAPRYSKTGRALYSAIFWPYLFTSCAALFWPALVLYAVSLPFDRRRRLLHRFTGVWASHYLAWAPLAGVRVEGLEKVEGIGPCIYVSNHQSMVDILAIFAIPKHFLWVSKVENFYVPFLGWNMLLNGYVPLKRGHLPSIMRMVRMCNRRLREGHSLFVFPEGTRSPDGDLKAFYSGAFRLAAKNRVPIVPVLLEGSNRVLPKGSMSIDPQPVRVVLLDPVYPDSVDFQHKLLHDKVRRSMLEEQARLRGHEPRIEQAGSAYASSIKPPAAALDA